MKHWTNLTQNGRSKFQYFNLLSSLINIWIKKDLISEKERKKAERERKRQEARENAEKKKRFSLTPEKKRKLKLLIMQKAADDLKAEAERKKAAKQAYVDQKVRPLPPDLSALNEAQLVAICKDLHKQIAEQEEERYTMEMKIRKQDYEINELTIKVNDIKGKFIKPTLKKVNKTQSKFAKLEKLQEAPPTDFRVALKSTGKDKFALEEDKPDEKVDFRAQLQSTKDVRDDE